MKHDKIVIEILEDGTIRTSTPGSVSAANHSSAEQFYRMMATLTDTSNVRQKLPHAHTHVHQAQEVKV